MWLARALAVGLGSLIECIIPDKSVMLSRDRMYQTDIFYQSSSLQDIFVEVFFSIPTIKRSECKQFPMRQRVVLPHLPELPHFQGFDLSSRTVKCFSTTPTV